MERKQRNTNVAGIDVGKFWLDVAIHGRDGTRRFANDEAGLTALVAWLAEEGVVRAGLEATAGYERPARSRLEAEGVQVIVHQPLEVRLFARLKRWKAKTDRLDAVLIAAATVQVEAVRAARDPRLVELAQRLTAYEHIADKTADLKTFMEHVDLPDLVETLGQEIRSLSRLKARLAADILARIKACPDLLARYRLLLSLPGVGPVVAASLLIRMPELGAMRRGQPAALIGVAPFDRQSGQWKGQSVIGGGRARPRRMLYLAAIAAKRCDPAFKAFAQRLIEAAKPPKVAIVAVMRKLIEAANLVLQRQQPWTAQTTPTT
jgi:transposase